MFDWIRKWRYKQLASRPFPQEWLIHLQTHVPFYKTLPTERIEDFHEKLKIFVWDKVFIGAGGMEITDEVKVVIAATAVRLILHLDLLYYRRLTEIVVYPDHYRHPDQEDGYVMGEAHQWGTMVLSWRAVLHGLHNPHDGQDTATHEFAHVLDIGGGQFDGTPVLRANHDYQAWADTMSKHYLLLKEYSPAQKKVLDTYGTINEAEFFAVATESFFERGPQMARVLPDLYGILKQFYGWDPATPTPPDPSPAPKSPSSTSSTKWNIQKGKCA